MNNMITKTYKRKVLDVDTTVYRERGLNDPDNKRPYMVLYRSEIQGRNCANSRNFETKELAELFIKNLQRQLV